MTLGGMGVAQLDPEAFRGESVCSVRGWAGDHGDHVTTWQVLSLSSNSAHPILSWTGELLR